MATGGAPPAATVTDAARLTDGAPAAAMALVPLTVGMLAGGVIASERDAGVGLLAAAGAVAVASLAVVAARRVRLVALALVIGAAAGALRAIVAAAPLPPDHIARRVGRVPLALDATIVESDRAGGALRLVVRAARYRCAAGRGRARGLVAVTIAHPTRQWPAGLRVRIVGRLRAPRGFGNPGGYDPGRALARRDIFATMFLWDERGIAALRRARGAVPRLATALADARVAIGAAIDAGVDEPARGFLHAVLIGEDGALADDARRVLARTGLSHVISVSGFHLAVVAAAVAVGARWVLVRCEYAALRWNVAKLAAIAGLPAIAVYVALAGGSVPASRSLLMYAAVVTALLADRRADGWRALGAAALVLALLVPDVAADISFELSFASVAALVFAGTPAPRRTAPGRGRRIARLAAAGMRVSVAATVATAPLTAWHFQQVSLIAPVANLVALPLLGPGTLLPGLCALPFVPLAPAVARALLAAAGLSTAVGLRLAALLAAIPGAALDTPMPTVLEVGLAYAVIGWFVAGSGLPPRVRWGVLAAVMTVVVADGGYWAWERLANPRLRVTFLSVGQGDAAVVELPRGGTVVVDGGGMPGGFDPGERLIAPFLRSRKIVHVDVLALSHPQLDHYGGLAYLAEHFAPREFWSNGLTARAPGFARLERALDAAGTRRVSLRAGTRALTHAGAAIDVLHPSAPEGEDLNDGSLVLRVRYGRASVLFTGDLERDGELEMLADGVDVASVILKVGHHGSATSTSPPLLAAVAPRVAVVSAGADNRFGFPAPAVLARVRATGAEIWRTDQDGAVRVESDGVRMLVTAPCGARPPRALLLGAAVAPRRFEFPTPLW